MKRINIFTIVFALVAFMSCNDFGDMNTNPNAPTQINNNPELLMTGICKNTTNQMVANSWGQGNVMAQYSAKIVFTSFDLFEWGTNSGTWSVIYRNAREIQNLETIAETIENDSYKAVGLIMKSWMFQIATDMWGDIPYSEALKGKTEDVFMPQYDPQKDIYASLLADLELANELLKNANSAIKGDIIFNGNLDNWRRFGNSLRLRVLIRLTNVSDSPVNVAAKIAEILNGSDNHPIMEDNTHNALLLYTTSFPNVHPRSQQSGHRIGSFDEYRMSETSEIILQANNDPRQEVFFAPTEASLSDGDRKYSGMINGMVDGSAYEYKGGPSNISKINPDRFYYSANSANGILMMASEVQFTIAEAALRYPEVAALVDPKVYYEKGIALNFNYWDVEMPDDFLQRESVNDFNVPVAFNNEIETVITQKWISLFYTDFQGFIEYKRTGFPRVIKPGPDANRNVYPSRFRYPNDELALNEVNFENAAERQAKSADYSYWTPVWWENK